MYKKIVPFNVAKFDGKRVRPVDAFHFAAGAHISSVLVNEISRVAPVYPIVFLKEKEDKYGLFALLGLQQGENLFVDAEGKWNAPYIPGLIRRYPFALGQGKDESQFVLCLDEESEFISETEGKPLVEDGKPGEVVEKVKNYLSELHRFNAVTARMVEEISKKELLMPLNMKLQTPGSDAPPLNISGCFGVNEAKLNELSDEDFLAFRKQGILPLIYAHLISLAQVERLARLRNELAQG